jgi:hypothetical protein
MLTAVSLLVATVPFAVVFALLAWANDRERRRRETVARQIALTDNVHQQLGAVAAPLVRRRRRGWQVSIAVPFERPAVGQALLAIVLQTFSLRDRPSLEIVLTRQPDPRTTRLAGRPRIGWESPSWT